MTYYQMPYYKEQHNVKSSEELEEETADVFFPDNMYEMLHRTHDFNTTQKRFVRSSLNPDFHFEIREEPRANFWVESELREIHQVNEFINVFNNEQLTRYQSFAHSFLFLCVKIQREQYYYFIPFSHIKSNDLHFSFLNAYAVSFDMAINPELVRKYLR
jgi:hypothetical protein